MWETLVQSLGWEDPLEEGMATHLLQYSCLENPHGQRSLAGYSPWGCKESDTTEQLSTHTRTHTHTQRIHVDNSLKKIYTHTHTHTYDQ